MAHTVDYAVVQLQTQQDLENVAAFDKECFANEFWYAVPPLPSPPHLILDFSLFSYYLLFNNFMVNKYQKLAKINL